MARAGVYFSDVKKARDQLIAQGRRPSIDAVRAALGDTGSKTTIHKYLREIEAEEAGQGAAGSSASAAILQLAAQLAEQLAREAEVGIEVVRAEMAGLRQQEEGLRAALSDELHATTHALAGLRAGHAASVAELTACKETLRAEQMARHTLEQQVRDLDARLNDAKQHQASLEEKHQHARDALAHYRDAAKEQREQEVRRHEQQVQALQVELRQAQQAAAVKQEELTRLNKEAASLVTELAAQKQAAHLARELARELTRDSERQQGEQRAALQAQATRIGVLEAQLPLLQEQLAESRAQATQQAQLAADQAQAATQARADGAALAEQNAALRLALNQASSAAALEARLAKLDQAVFGASQLAPPST